MKREKNAWRRARIEKNDVSGRVYTPTQGRRIKLCRSFPGENTRRVASPSIQCRQFPSRRFGLQLAEKCSCKKRSLRLREKAPLYPTAKRATMNFDGSFFPRGAFGRNDADLHYAIYVRDLHARAPAQFLDIRGWLSSPNEYRFAPFVLLFLFLFSCLFFILTWRFAVSLVRYTCVLCDCTSCFKLKQQIYRKHIAFKRELMYLVQKIEEK